MARLAHLHRPILGTFLLVFGTVAHATQAESRIAEGDAAWERRQVGGSGLDPAPEPIAEAIELYEAALSATPDNLELRWKLMRAIHYQGDYVLTTRDARLPLYERGRDIGEESLDRLAAEHGGREVFDRLAPAVVASRLADHPQATATYFWTCVHWGLWGRERGKLAAAREGVAHKVRDYAEVVAGLNENYEAAGAHRILGRLHFEAPRVPFITGWVDKKKVRPHLERAVEIAPEHPLNQLYLAEAVYDDGAIHRPKAIERLRQLIERGPRPDRPFEDGRTLVTARSLLAEWTR